MDDLDAHLARDVFERLAGTVTDNPARASQVQSLVRRRHRRRTARRATIGLGFATGIGIVAVAGTPQRAQPASTAASSESKDATPLASTPSSDPAKSGEPCTSGGADSALADPTGQVKVSGTITAVGESWVTIAVDEGTADVSSLTASLSADTVYQVATGTRSSLRPPLAVGDHVAFSALAGPDDTYTIDELHLGDDVAVLPTVDGPSPVEGAATPESSAAEQKVELVASACDRGAPG